jgi:taurine dioxygenase
MKVRTLKNNAVEAYDFDIYSDENIADLGRLVANESVVLVDQKLDQKRTYDVQMQWGSPAHSIVHLATSVGTMKGVHWNSLRLNILNGSSEIEPDYRNTMSVVTYQRNKKGRPKGVFANGILGWHSDQVALNDGDRIIGLVSVEHTEGSQTAFLCTKEAYNKLNHEDRTMVDELQSVYRWNRENFTGNLIDEQKQMVRYNQVPVDGMMCKLQQSTPSGVKGIHFPGTLFHKFDGMTEEESLKFKEYLWEKINRPEYIYTHDWKDGQVVYMEQNITLHARPTDIIDGNMRKLWRNISYMDKLYSGEGHKDEYTVDGKVMDGSEFLTLVDDIRREEYESGRKIAV